ncbi:MAG: aldehyde dehydrogenase family protein [Rhodobacteraceae bacterium]|nr:aldehyde dehydrogenase family protein [Paracoccaceae bacterium]
MGGTAPDREVETDLFIDGHRCRSSNGNRYRLHNPARPDEIVGSAPAATAEDVDRAVKAAHAAFPDWSSRSYEERAALLRSVAAQLVADTEDIAFRSRLFCREHGKILKETMLEISRLDLRFRQSADYAERLSKDEVIAGPPFDTIVTRQPRGVAALIVPWNWPLSILGAKLPQALVAGNTVVVKPSRNAALAPSLTLSKIASLLPPGVVNFVTGAASEIGDPLVSHELVRYVNFTGSIDVGRHIMKLAADNITPVTLELGGNDPAIICHDAELNEAAFSRLYLGAFMSSGQVCMAIKRLFVHRSRYDETVDGMTRVCNTKTVGDGLLPETDIGPLNNAGQHRIVTDMIAQAKASGAELRECGEVPDMELYRKGYFQKPALVLDPEPDLDIVREEQFGPALPIIAFDSEDEVIAKANDSRFGLCSSVWTRDRDRAVALSRRLEAGYTYLNAHGPMAQDGRGPFGGFKQSGIGRNLGYEGVIQFQEYHSISGPEGWLL